MSNLGLRSSERKDSEGFPMKRFAAPFSITSHASAGVFLHSVSFFKIPVVMEKGMLEKTL